MTPYPPPRRGEKFRRIPFPVDRPDHTRAPMTASRRDGTEVDIRRSLGLPSVAAPDEDEGAHWERVTL